VSIDELMDVASEPQEFSIYTATNFSALTQDITNRLTDTVCNSEHPFTIFFHYCVFVYSKTPMICVSILSCAYSQTHFNIISLHVPTL